MRVDCVEAREDHALDIFETGESIGARMCDVCDGVANFGVGDVLDGCDEEADLACTEFVERDGFGGHDAHGFDVELAAVGHDLDAVALAQAAVDDACEDDDAAVGVEPGVEDEGLQGGFGVAAGWWQQHDDGFEDVGDVEAGFGADADGVGCRQADGFFDHGLGAFDVGAWQIDLVDDGNDFEAVGYGEVRVREGLCFDALGGVDDEERAFAGGE